MTFLLLGATVECCHSGESCCCWSSLPVSCGGAEWHSASHLAEHATHSAMAESYTRKGGKEQIHRHNLKKPVIGISDHYKQGCQRKCFVANLPYFIFLLIRAYLY